MPARSLRRVLAVFASIFLASQSGPPAQAQISPAVDARIAVADDLGMAPFTVHVHGLSSQAGDPTTALFEWNFDDPGSPFNHLDGWNAAHTYRRPGVYRVRLKVTDGSGRTSVQTRRIEVRPDTRKRIYVSPSGDDSGPGTASAPVRTAGRALQLVHNNVTVLFQRGGQYTLASPFHLEASNVVLGAYGSGPDPVLQWVGNIQYAGIVSMWAAARDVTIQNLQFDSFSQPNNEIVRGIQPDGRNITVAGCTFRRVSYAVNSEFGVNDMLVQGNHAQGIGAYFIWAVGQDHVYLGNDVSSNTDEHTIRLGYAKRVLIAHNDLTNTAKATIWAMLGDHCYIAHNVLRKGRVLIGPNFAVGGSSERFRFCVADGNKVLDEGFVLYSGAEEVMLRNNIVRADGRDAITIWGWYSPMSRTVSGVKVYNNTASNDSSENGCFLRLGDGAENLRVVNNLYFAPMLNSNNNAANVYSSAGSLNSQLFRNNIWSKSVTASWTHFLWGGSGVAPAQWNAFSQTDHEVHRAFGGWELDDTYRPRFDAEHGCDMPGAQKDFLGRSRPSGGRVTVGAIEMR